MLLELKKKGNIIHLSYENIAFINIEKINNKSIFLHLMKVIPKKRNQGIAKKAFEKLINLLKKKGYKEIELNVLPLEVSNCPKLEKLKKFYQNFGFMEIISNDKSKPNLMRLQL